MNEHQLKSHGEKWSTSIRQNVAPGWIELGVGKAEGLIVEVAVAVEIIGCTIAVAVDPVDRPIAVGIEKGHDHAVAGATQRPLSRS